MISPGSFASAFPTAIESLRICRVRCARDSVHRARRAAAFKSDIAPEHTIPKKRIICSFLRVGPSERQEIGLSRFSNRSLSVENGIGKERAETGNGNEANWRQVLPRCVPETWLAQIVTPRSNYGSAIRRNRPAPNPSIIQRLLASSIHWNERRHARHLTDTSSLSSIAPPNWLANLLNLNKINRILTLLEIARKLAAVDTLTSVVVVVSTW
jgi:hypothetical protein